MAGVRSRLLKVPLAPLLGGFPAGPRHSRLGVQALPLPRGLVEGGGVKGTWEGAVCANPCREAEQELLDVLALQ